MLTAEREDLDEDDPPPDDPEPAPPAKAGRSSRRYWLLLLLPLVVGGALRAVAGSADDVITTDGSAYLRSGTSIWAGEGFQREGHPELHFPPVTPTLLGGAADLLDDALAGTVVVTIITGALVLLPIAGIARLLGGDRAGLAAAWIAAFALGLITVPANQGGGSENPFMFLVLSAVWAALGVAGRRDKWLYVGTAASGLCIGLAYLTRPEGIGYSAIVFPVLIAGALGRRGRHPPAATRPRVTAEGGGGHPLLRAGGRRLCRPLRRLPAHQHRALGADGQDP